MSLGARKIVPDRMEYIQEISESWKKQMLYNIVKLRYFDPPTFLDVSSIISQYAIENQVNADGRWYWPSTSGAYAGIGGYSRYSDKPTITYTPLSGNKFTKNLLTPIPPIALINLIQSGWAIDIILSLGVKTINGISNSFAAMGSNVKKEDFNRVVQAMRKIQLAGASDIRVEKVNDKESIVFVISDSDKKEMFRQEIDDIRRILKIKPEINSYKIVFGSLANSDDEIALLTYSMLEMMLEAASKIEVPEKHIIEKRVKETGSFYDDGSQTRIYSSRDKPKDAFAAIRYQNYWFYIDNKDIASKRNFALMMIFMSLTETEQKGAGPLLTIGN
jgi:hypothetical protein